MKAVFQTLIALLLLAAGAAWGDVLDRIVAVVEQDVILASELEEEAESIRQELRRRGAAPPSDDELHRHVLERLIMQRIQLARAERAGLRVDDATLDATVSRIAAQNNMTLSQLHDALARDGIEFSRFREELRQEIAINRLQQARVESQVEVTPREIEEALETAATDDGVEYHVAHIQVSTPEGASAAEIREARQRATELHRRVTQNEADFEAIAAAFSDARTATDGGSLGWRLPGQLPSAFAELVPELQPGEISDVIQAATGFHIVKLLDTRREGIETVEETRARHILVRTDDQMGDEDAQGLLVELLKRIEAGEAFADLAREHSQDPGSAPDGGDLGWTAPGLLVPAFQEVMDGLEPDEISEPFPTQFGWHIVQVEDRRVRDITDERRRERIAEQIYQRKSQEALEQWLRRLREEAYVEYRLEG